MELHVYYYPILILFLANSASAILQNQNEIQHALGDLFGDDSGLDDDLDNIFQDQPQQSRRQQLGLNFGNFDDLNQYIHPQQTKSNRHFGYNQGVDDSAYNDHEKCEQKVVPFYDVVKIVKIIFEKFPSICVSRMKLCGTYPGPTNPYPKPTYPYKPSGPYKPADPYQHPSYSHGHHGHRNLKQNPLFVRSMDSVNSNSTSEDGWEDNNETPGREGQSTDFEEGNGEDGKGEDGKERSKRSTGEEGYPPHYDNYYHAYNDYNNHHPYHYGGYQNSYNNHHPYHYGGYQNSYHYNSPYDNSIYLDPYDQGVKNYKDYLHHKHVNEKYPNRYIYLDPYDQGVKNYKDYLHHKYVNEKYPNSDRIVFL